MEHRRDEREKCLQKIYLKKLAKAILMVFRIILI